MKKLFLLAIFCLAFYQAVQAGSSKKNCYVSIYTPEPPIQCETVIINGKPEESCSQVGPGEALVVLNSKTRWFSIDDEIAEFDYYGNCRCTFKFWSKPHFKGLTPCGQNLSRLTSPKLKLFYLIFSLLLQEQNKEPIVFP